MANVKLFVDHALLSCSDAGLDGLMAEMRTLLCVRLQVAEAACQLAVVGVTGLPDQPAVNVELSILPKPERTREMLTALCEALRERVVRATGARAAIRCAQLDGTSYIALK